MDNPTTHNSRRCEGNRCECIADVGYVHATATGDVAPRARVLGEALRAAMRTADDDLWSLDLMLRARSARGPELDADEAAEVEARLDALSRAAYAALPTPICDAAVACDDDNF